MCDLLLEAHREERYRARVRARVEGEGRHLLLEVHREERAVRQLLPRVRRVEGEDVADVLHVGVVPVRVRVRP